MAFYNCTRLRRLAGDRKDFGSLDGAAFPESLREIGESAFENCQSLSHVALNEGLETLGASAFLISGLQSVRLPGTLKTLPNKAF